MNVPETFFSVDEELRLFGLSCLFGAAFGVVYDLFRTVRLLLPHNGAMVAAEDIAFLALYGVFLPAFASAAARGELRFYFALGNIIGFVLYIATVGTAVVGVMRRIAALLKKLIRVASYPFRRGYVFLRTKAKAKFVGCSKITVNPFKKMKILLPKSGRMLYNKKANNKRKNVTNVGKKEKKGEKRPVQ